MSDQEAVFTEHACPIAKVHSRLEQAHQLWHDSEQRYFDPEAFPTYLNSCIQALRTVTWVLQKYKAAIPDFDAWYAGWQTEMRKDPIMAWLVQARNRIEKQGDLEGKSLARVSLINSYIEGKTVEIELNPLTTSAEITKKVSAELGPPPPNAEDASVRVERRWVEVDLPDHEVLDALAYAYGVLSQLVADAHKQLGLPDILVRFGPEPEDVGQPVPFHGGRLPCMVAGEEARSTTMMVATGEAATIHKLAQKRDDALDKAAIERYGAVPEEFASRMKDAQNLEDRSKAYFAMAKGLLVKDGYHNTIAMLFNEKRPLKIIKMQYDYAGKYLMWRNIAREVETLGATSIIVVGEMWQAHFDAASTIPFTKVADVPDKIEVLSVHAESMEGEIISLSCPFSRDEKGNIVLGNDEELKPEGPGFTEPIRKVWHKWKHKSGGSA